MRTRHSSDINNKSLSFTSYIFNQKDPNSNANKVLMGGYPSSFNGCGWIAIYNALISMGKFEHPAEIVKWLVENNGLSFGGAFGVKAKSVEEYFNASGYKANIFYKDFETHAKNGDAVVMRYSWYKGGLNYGEHYIAGSYNSQASEYEFYNVYNNSTGMHPYQDLNAFITDGGKRTISYYNDYTGNIISYDVNKVNIQSVIVISK